MSPTAIFSTPTFPTASSLVPQVGYNLVFQPNLCHSILHSSCPKMRSCSSVSPSHMSFPSAHKEQSSSVYLDSSNNIRYHTHSSSNIQRAQRQAAVLTPRSRLALVPHGLRSRTR